jgi:hypothetical protein
MIGHRLAPATLLAAVIIAGTAHQVQAQTAVRHSDQDTSVASPLTPHYWRDFAAGFASSLLVHEAGHIATSLVLGGHPTFGLAQGRPTVYSGFSAQLQPQKQFAFSSMGLNAQAALDETILDVPHAGGSPFERGVLASGIATALFYITIGRNASVSDVEFMSRTSSLSKTDITIIYGGIAAIHTVRIHRNANYANFFVRPAAAGERGLRVGVHLSEGPP